MSVITLDRLAQSDPDKVAIVDPRGCSWSRWELVDLVNRISRALRDAGVAPSDTIVAVCPNSVEYLAVYFSVLQIGAYFVPVNWHLSHDEIAHIVRTSGAKVLVVHQRHCEAMVSALSELADPPALRIVVGRFPGFIELESLIRNVSGEPLGNAVAGRLMVFTSATTGRPKAIRRPLSGAAPAFARLLDFAARFNRDAGVDPNEGAHLCQSMLYHVAPLDSVTAAVFLGQTIALMDHWRAEDALALIEKYGIRATVMVPSMFVRLLKLPEATKRRYSTQSLAIVFHGSAPCPVEIKQQMIAWWGPVLFEIYGAAEGGGTGIDSAEWLRRPGSVGRAHPGATVKILDDEGREMAPGAVGNIYIRPYTGDRFEYLGEPEKTLAAYRGELFTVGDLGYLDEEGFLYICDRRTDMIISGGVNVYSAEVERALVVHPAVADCAVFGVPDDLLGESVMAVIELMPGVERRPQLRADITRMLAKSISAEKLPRQIEFTDKVPRDPAGKLLKRRLRDPYWEGRKRLI